MRTVTPNQILAVMHQLDEDGILGAGTFRDNHHSIKRALEAHEAAKPKEHGAKVFISSQNGELLPHGQYYNELEPSTEYELVLRKKPD